jgi:hypothetical protein
MAIESDLAELSSVTALLDELAKRLEAVAGRHEGVEGSSVANDLHQAERGVVGARRAIDRAVRSLSR